MYGGNGSKIFNDIRCLDPYTMEWSVIQPDEDKNDLVGRFGHSISTWKKYFFAFGGLGPSF
jgi:hypothetical protein